MPSTVGSLVLFVALLTPGFVFLARTETRVAGEQYTALRETAVIVSASLLFGGAAVMLLGLLRVLSPAVTPDVGELVRDPETYLEEHYVRAGVWAAVLLAVACALASTAAVPPAGVRRLAGRLKMEGLVAAIDRRSRAPIAAESAWTSAFNADPEAEVHLGLRLADGTYMYGRLCSFNPQIEETNSRSLVLAPPLWIRPPSTDDLHQMEDAGRVVLSAGEIKTMAIHYVRPQKAGKIGATPPSATERSRETT